MKPYYVYLIAIDGTARYVGKGKGMRAWAHRARAQWRLRGGDDFPPGNKFEAAMLDAIATGKPISEIFLATNLDEDEALQLESETIRSMGIFDQGGALLNSYIPIYTPADVGLPALDPERETKSMTPIELRLALEALRLSQSAFGRMIQSEPRQVRRWLAGDAKVPGPVVIIVRFMRRMQKDHGRDALMEFFGAAKVRPKRQKEAA